VNYNEMSAAHCADWLAEKDGWVKTLAKGADESDGEDGYFWAKGGKWQWEHPMPLTLDAAAGALREPWYIHLMHFTAAHVSVRLWRQNTACWKNVHGPDEMTARYRAAVAARMEEER